MLAVHEEPCLSIDRWSRRWAGTLSRWPSLLHRVWFVLPVGEIEVKEPTALFAKSRGRSPRRLWSGLVFGIGATVTCYWIWLWSAQAACGKSSPHFAVRRFWISYMKNARHCNHHSFIAFGYVLVDFANFEILQNFKKPIIVPIWKCSCLVISLRCGPKKK